MGHVAFRGAVGRRHLIYLDHIGLAGSIVPIDWPVRTSMPWGRPPD